MVAILPVAALDAGRLHWSQVPLWLVAGGYAALLAGIAVTAWAQAVNPFFEPGVRIQSERHQRVIDSRSEEHTSELQSLMRISYAVFCLKKKKIIPIDHKINYTCLHTPKKTDTP